MIKFLNENAPFPLLDDGVFSLRQRAFFDSYGVTTDFFFCWVQTDENGHVTAVITSLSGDVTLALKEEADFEEISEFLNVIGFSSIFFNKKYAPFLPFETGETGKIMVLEKTLTETDYTPIEPDYRGIFRLLFENGNVSFPDWFTDTSHRLRHGTALADFEKKDGKTVACAFCQAMADGRALIGSVKTDEEYRKNGIGTRLVSRLSAYLQQRGFEVFLCRKENENRDFYSRIGFCDCGEWVSVKK